MNAYEVVRYFVSAVIAGFAIVLGTYGAYNDNWKLINLSIFVVGLMTIWEFS